MHRKIGRAQQQATPLTKPLLNQLLGNCDNSVRGLRNQVLLRLGYETMRRRSELCAFKFEDILRAPNGKPAIRLNYSKTDQFGTGKTLSISQELFDLLANWKSTIGDESYILRSISRHRHIGENLHPASISTLLKALQKDLKMDSDEQPLSGHSFRVGGSTRSIRTR
jgi:integrase